MTLAYFYLSWWHQLVLHNSIVQLTNTHQFQHNTVGNHLQMSSSKHWTIPIWACLLFEVAVSQVGKCLSDSLFLCYFSKVLSWFCCILGILIKSIRLISTFYDVKYWFLVFQKHEKTLHKLLFIDLSMKQLL